MLWKIAGLFAVSAVALFAIRAPASDALAGPGIIRITDRVVAFSKVDVGRPGMSTGDLEITRSRLFNKGITAKALGTAVIVCTVTGGTARSCTGTYALPAGKIMVGGTIQFRQFFQLAVVGGTDRYNNVRGTLTVTSLGGKPRQNVVLFRLVV
jgi:hypothetical protein